MSNALLLDRSIAARNQERLARAPLLLFVRFALASIIHHRRDSTATTRLQPELRARPVLGTKIRNPPPDSHMNRSPAVMGQELHRESLQLQVAPITRRRRRGIGDIDIHIRRQAPPGARIPTPRRARGVRRRDRRRGRRGPDKVPRQRPLRSSRAAMLRL